VALIALGLAAIYPVLVELSTVVVAENLLVAFVLAAIYAALRVRTARRPTRWVVAAGVFTGLAALTHTNGLVLVIPMVVAMWNLRHASQPPAWAERHRWTAPLLLVLVSLVTVTPWLIRDAVALHTFVPISDEAGITLAGTYNATTAHESNPPWRWRFFASSPSLRRQVGHQRTMTEPELSSRLESVTLHYIGHHPFTPVQVGFDNTLRLLELEGTRAQRISDASIGLTYGEARIGVYAFWLLLILAIAGLFTRAVRSVPRWLWLVPLLFWLSVVLVNSETPRFREPLEPFLILSAACALAALARRVSTALSARPALAGVSAHPAHAGGTVTPAEKDPAPS